MTNTSFATTDPLRMLPGLASEFESTERIDIQNGNGPTPYRVGESAIPADILVIAKGRYSQRKNGLTGAISLTAVNEATVRKMRNSPKVAIVAAIIMTLMVSGFAALVIFNT